MKEFDLRELYYREYGNICRTHDWTRKLTKEEYTQFVSKQRKEIREFYKNDIFEKNFPFHDFILTQIMDDIQEEYEEVVDDIRRMEKSKGLFNKVKLWN